MDKHIDGMLKSGLIESTTHSKYKSEASLIFRFIKDVPLNKITGAMVRKTGQEMLAEGYTRETVDGYLAAYPAQEAEEGA